MDAPDRHLLCEILSRKPAKQKTAIWRRGLPHVLVVQVLAWTRTAAQTNRHVSAASAGKVGLTKIQSSLATGMVAPDRHLLCEILSRKPAKQKTAIWRRGLPHVLVVQVLAWTRTAAQTNRHVSAASAGKVGVDEDSVVLGDRDGGARSAPSV